ncbi:MAG: hypothetical protein JNK73_11595 [Bacteroidia bacterium]|nr:hypothetical protein [Bacteroidia bacterium]
MQAPKKLPFFFSSTLFLFGMYYYCVRVVGWSLEFTPGDYGDSRFINYVLEHGVKWLKGIEPDFWRANFMYPLENNIALSDCMAGTLPIYALFRFLNLDTETSFQMWWISCSALNYICADWAFRKLNLSPYWSALGAFVFAFGINNLNQFMHLQMNCKFFIPLAIACLFLFLNSGKVKHFVLFMLSFIFQFYSNAYMGIFLALFSLLFAILYLSVNSRFVQFTSRLSPKKYIYISLTLLVSLGSVLLLAIPYYKMNKSLPLNYDYISYNLPEFWSYLLPHDNVIAWRFLTESPIKVGSLWYIHNFFPGLFVYAGLILSFFYTLYWLIKIRKGIPTPLILFLVCSVFLLLFSRTSDKHSLFSYLQPLWGFSHMRLPGRFMIVLVFVMIWASLWFLNSIHMKNNFWLAAFLVPLVILDNSFEIRKGTLLTSAQNRIYRTEVFKELIKQSNTANNKIVAVINTKNQDELFQNDVMLATQQLGLYTFNGYSSTCYDELCYAFHDPKHLKLNQWMQRHYMDTSKITFILY